MQQQLYYQYFVVINKHLLWPKTNETLLILGTNDEMIIIVINFTKHNVSSKFTKKSYNIEYFLGYYTYSNRKSIEKKQVPLQQELNVCFVYTIVT